MNANLKVVLENVVAENQCAFLCAVDETCSEQVECEEICNMLLTSIANDAKMTLSQIWEEVYFITSRYGDFCDYDDCSHFESTI